MFTKPLDEWLKQPMSIIETWLSLIQPAFDAARTDDAGDLSDRSDDSSEARRTLGAWLYPTENTTEQLARCTNRSNHLAESARPG